MRRGLLPLVLMLAACGGEPAASTTVPVEPPTTSTIEAIPTTTSTEPAGPVVLPEDVYARLSAGVSYRLLVSGLTVDITPPTEGWELLYYLRSGTEAGALFSWRGPSGFRSETLNVLIRQVAGDGVTAAWSRVDAIGDAGQETTGEPWQLTAEGTGRIGSVQADWREYRTPPWTDIRDFGDDNQFAYSLRGGGGAARLLRDTSVRFYVAPLRDLTLTVVGYETRCACIPNRIDGYDRGDQIADDTENELDDWLPELDAFLANLAFGET